MPERVEAEFEISLNGVKYPVIGPIRSAVASVQPARILIGESSKDTHPDVSVAVYRDWRDGVGKDSFEGTRDAARAWTSDLHLRHHEQLVLPRLVTQMAASGVSGSFDVEVINEHSGSIWAAFGSTILKLNNTANTWGSSQSLAAAATDAINIRLGGTEYLVVATTTDYDFYDGTTWTRATTDVVFLAFWDDRLWGINADGQLWWATELGTGKETNDAQTPLPSGNVSNLFVGRSPSGDLTLYCATTHGLFAHDQGNQRFVETELQIPRHEDNGLGAVRHQDATYISAGMPIYKYINGQNNAVITLVGPDRDDGVPVARRGRIRELHSSVNDLFALIDATSAPSALNAAQGQVPGNADVAAPDSGFSHIMGLDDRGWMEHWVSADATKAITTGHVSTAHSEYNLWFGHNQFVSKLPLDRDVTNPSELADRTYHAGPRTHEFPLFDAGEHRAKKLALRFIVETTGCTSTETVAVSYDLDRSGSFTALGTITTNGITTYEFPNATTPTGILFECIRFRYILDRGSTTTLSPNVRIAELHFVKFLPVKWGHTVTVDLRNDELAEERFINLRTAIESSTLVELTFRNRDSNDFNYFVRVKNATGLEFTGNNWVGQVTLSMTEI